MKIELIAGDGCTGTGWKKFPTDMSPKDILRLYIDTLTEDAAESFLFDIVLSSYDDYTDGDYCEQCGDNYVEYTLTIELEERE